MLTIGHLTFKSNLIQGPLAGVSASPFRSRFYQYDAPAFCVTEMISAIEVVDAFSRLKRYVHRASNETTLSYQLSGTCPDYLANAAKKLQSIGADLIDLNCGCPKPKIRKKGAGSKLIEDSEHLAKLVLSIKKNIDIPLTVKIRLLANHDEKQEVLLAKKIAKSGADALIVHGRTHLDDYDKAVNHQRIANIKSNLNIPVIANGDVKDKASYQKLLSQTGADGVMVSRAGMGKPWLYQSIKDSNFKADISMAKAAFLAHLKDLCQLECEKIAILQSRAWSKYYFRDFYDSDWLNKLRQKETLTEIDKHLN